MGDPKAIHAIAVDARGPNRFLPPLYKPYQSDTLEGLAKILEIDAKAFVETMHEYNRGAAGNKAVKMQILDGVTTRGVTPPKTNWALPIDSPPYYGLPLRPGITFTYTGVTIDDRARVVDRSGRPFKNVYAAGEIVSGNILTKGYLGGMGLAIGAILGELGGRDAALNARS